MKRWLLRGTVLSWRPWASWRLLSWGTLESPAQEVAAAEIPVAETVTAEISGQPIQLSGNEIWRWQIDGADASLLQGECVLQHEGKTIAAKRVLMVADGPVGNVRCRIVASGVSGQSSPDPIAWTVHTLVDPLVQSPRFNGAPEGTPDLLGFLPGKTQNTTQGTIQGTTGLVSNPVEQVQFTGPSSQEPAASESPAPSGTTFLVAGGTRSVQIRGRSASSPFVLQNVNRPESGDTVVVARGGVTILVRDVSTTLPDGQLLDLGTISLSADRIVGWFPQFTDVFGGKADLASADGELYLEGDIVFPARPTDHLCPIDVLQHCCRARHGAGCRSHHHDPRLPRDRAAESQGVAASESRQFPSL